MCSKFIWMRMPPDSTAATSPPFTSSGGEDGEETHGGFVDAKVSLNVGRPCQRSGHWLMLAPNPTVFSAQVEAGNHGSPVAPWIADDFCGGSSMDPLADHRPCTYGSRFWVSADSMSSDEEESSYSIEENVVGDGVPS